MIISSKQIYSLGIFLFLVGSIIFYVLEKKIGVYIALAGIAIILIWTIINMVDLK